MPFPLHDSAHALTACGHSFHAACLDHYFQTLWHPGQRPRCPCCRSPVHAVRPIEVRAKSDRALEVTSVPAVGGRCHFDRNYCFLDLGDFAKANMVYVLSSNDDRKTPATHVMCIVEANQPCSIHLNYRSEHHVEAGHQETWLGAKGFVRNGDLPQQSAVAYPMAPIRTGVFKSMRKWLSH